jgi:tripartite-type tricarboxylate transporter receptor subunit TctC
VRIVVPYAPGGQTDTVARLTAQKMQAALGQSVVIDNRAGAGGRIATEFVAKAAPDGYTFLMASIGPQTISPAFEKVNYDPIKDFAPVSNVNTNPLVLLVHPKVPASNVKELIAYAKANPGKLNSGTGGLGGMTHLSGEMFAHMAGIKLTQVHYKGGAPSIAAILGGQVDMVFANYSDAIPQIQTGKLKALGITSAKRMPQTPEVPTIAEAGLPGYSAEGWNGLVAPAGTPPEIIKRVAAIVQEMARDPAYQKRFADMGSTVIGDTPEQFRAFIAQEVPFWAKFFKDTGLRVQN